MINCSLQKCPVTSLELAPSTITNLISEPQPIIKQNVQQDFISYLCHLRESLKQKMTKCNMPQLSPHLRNSEIRLTVISTAIRQIFQHIASYSFKVFCPRFLKLLEINVNQTLRYTLFCWFSK